MLLTKKDLEAIASALKFKKIKNENSIVLTWAAGTASYNEDMPRPVFTQAQEKRIVAIVKEEIKKEIDKLRLEFLRIFELNGFKTK